MDLRPTKGDEDAERINQLAGGNACPTWTNVGQALSPANSGKKGRVFKGVPMGLRPTKSDEDAGKNRLAGESACSTWTKPWGRRFRLPTLRVFNGA